MLYYFWKLKMIFSNNPVKTNNVSLPETTHRKNEPLMHQARSSTLIYHNNSSKS